MAKIKNSIHLQDRMTPVFKSMLRSMDSTLKAMEKIDKQASRGVQSKAYRRAEKDIQRANNQLIKMQNHTDQASNKFHKLGGSTDKISKNMQEISKSGFNLVNLSAALYLLKNIKSLTEDIMEAPDRAIATRAKLGLLSDSPYTDSQLYAQVYKTALDSRSGLDKTGDLVSRIMASGIMTGPNAAQGSIKATELINKALVAGGGTKEQNERAMLQIAQAISTGELKGVELRALRRQAPYLSKIITEGLGKIDPKLAGKSPMDLTQMAAAGEVTSDKILKSFLLMEDEINEAFKRMPRTFGQAMTQMSNVWQYFLYMLSEGDGALAKINEKVWQFVDYLSSADGETFLQSIATAFTVVVDIILWGVDVIVASFNWLRDHAEVVQSALIAMSVVATIAATAMAVAWIIAYSPILLIVGGLTLLIYGFMQLGYTAGEVIGFIAGSVMWLGSIIWDIAMLIIGIISIIVLTGWNLLQGFFLLIWDGLVFIGAAFQTVFWDIVTVIGDTMSIAVSVVQGMVVTVLELLQWVAKGIDFIFGSNLADTVGNWIGSVNGLAGKILDKLDTSEIATLQEDLWKDAPFASLDKFAVDPFAVSKGMEDMGLLLDPTKAFKSGMNFGKGLDGYLDKMDFTMGLGDMPDILKNFDMNNIGINPVSVKGGDLDSVGKIKSDVNISDEDIRLLRDIAAKEFLLNLSAITPQAIVHFGDVRESADVNVIMDIIEDMVENAFATSLVTD